MARMTKEQKTETAARGLEQGGNLDIGSPISNEAYNVIAALHEKLEGLEAYRKYSKDGDPELWRTIARCEIEGVEHLCHELERLVREDKFRTKQPGRGKA
jgi:hypothetical protein